MQSSRIHLFKIERHRHFEGWINSADPAIEAQTPESDRRLLDDPQHPG
jgi:hypothetical protein